MEKEVKIVYTEAFDQIVENLINYLSSFSDQLSVIERLEKLTDAFESRVNSPTTVHSCQISPILLQELGVTAFREYNHDGFRLLYRTFETDTQIIVEASALLAHKQDVTRVMVDYCLVYR